MGSALLIRQIQLHRHGVVVVVVRKAHRLRPCLPVLRPLRHVHRRQHHQGGVMAVRGVLPLPQVVGKVDAAAGADAVAEAAGIDLRPGLDAALPVLAPGVESKGGLRGQHLRPQGHGGLPAGLGLLVPGWQGQGDPLGGGGVPGDEVVGQFHVILRAGEIPRPGGEEARRREKQGQQGRQCPPHASSSSPVSSERAFRTRSLR